MSFFLFFSILGHRVLDVPKPAFNVYPATKFALTALCQTVRQEIRYNKLNIKLTVSIRFEILHKSKIVLQNLKSSKENPPFKLGLIRSRVIITTAIYKKI